MTRRSWRATAIVIAGLLTVVLLYRIIVSSKADPESGSTSRADAGDITPAHSDGLAHLNAEVKNDRNQLKPVATVPGSFQSHFMDVKRRAEHGSPEAQRELSEIYGRCMAIGTSPTKFLAGIDAISKQSRDARSSAMLVDAANDLVTTCAEVDGGAPVPVDANKLWLKAAASGGDLAAQVRLKMMYPYDSVNYEIETLYKNAVAAGDERALFDLGQLLLQKNDIPETKYSGALSGKLGPYALQIAACRYGLDCSAKSEVMKSLCLNTTACNFTDYESFIRSMIIPKSETEQLNGKINRIITTLPN